MTMQGDQLIKVDSNGAHQADEYQACVMQLSSEWVVYTEWLCGLYAHFPERTRVHQSILPVELSESMQLCEKKMLIRGIITA